MQDEASDFVDEAAVRAIYEQKKISIFFQPVVSVPAKAVVGFEAFARPTGKSCTVDTGMLFHKDLEPELTVKIDRMCREMALKQFKIFHDSHSGMLLFLNVNPAIFPHVEASQAVVPEQLADAGIAPECVVLECSGQSPYLDKKVPFAEKFRALGVQLGLDGCSESDAFSHVINRFEPDFIKIDRSFFGDDQHTECSARVLETVLNDAERAGAKVIGQGVETESESIRLLMAGVSLQQGYYYTKDNRAESGSQAAKLLQKIDDANKKYKKVKKELLRRRKMRFTETFKSLNSACAKFANMAEEDFEAGCKTLANRSEEIISVFILDANGVQITNRIRSGGHPGSPRAEAIMGMQKGADHSVQDYVMYLDMGYLQFVTKPFASKFSNEMACLISKPFYDKLGACYTLCLEMPYPG